MIHKYITPKKLRLCKKVSKTQQHRCNVKILFKNNKKYINHGERIQTRNLKSFVFKRCNHPIFQFFQSEDSEFYLLLM